MKKICILLCCVLLGSAAHAQATKKSKKATEKTAAAATPAPDAKAVVLPVLKNAKDSASYAYGVVLASNILRQISPDLDKDLLVAAMQSALKGDSLLFTKEDAGTYYATFNKQEQARRLEKDNGANRQAGIDFLAQNKKRPEVKTTASGLQYEVLQSGDPAGAMPTTASRVKVHYHGTLIDGNVFDSSIARKTPAEFGVTQVIKGWTEGLQLMHTGDKFKFFIPQELAYGTGSPSPKIKPFSTLIFEVELLEILPNK